MTPDVRTSKSGAAVPTAAANFVVVESSPATTNGGQRFIEDFQHRHRDFDRIRRKNSGLLD